MHLPWIWFLEWTIRKFRGKRAFTMFNLKAVLYLTKLQIFESVLKHCKHSSKEKQGRITTGIWIAFLRFCMNQVHIFYVFHSAIFCTILQIFCKLSWLILWIKWHSKNIYCCNWTLKDKAEMRSEVSRDFSFIYYLFQLIYKCTIGQQVGQRCCNLFSLFGEHRHHSRNSS